MKKLIFSKFEGLQAYSRQLCYQINSFTGIFWQHFKPSHAPPPCIDLSPPSDFEGSHPYPPLPIPTPHVLNTCGKPCCLCNFWLLWSELYFQRGDWASFSTRVCGFPNISWKIFSLKSFGNLWRRSYTKAIVLDVKSCFTCSESNLY